MQKIGDYSLYLVITEEYGLGIPALEIARLAILGGVDIIQMRQKDKGSDEALELACGFAKLCRQRDVIFIVNDDPLLAKEANADGVHLGQEDLKKYSVSQTRNIIGKDKIIGVSTHCPEELKKANEEDVNYIAYGPIFKTKTKDYFIGTRDIKKAVGISKKHIFFIGGITLSNLDEVLKEGARNIALIRGIIDAEDITARVKSFKDRMKMQRRIKCKTH